MIKKKINEIEKNGYCIIKNFLSKKKVNTILNKINHHYNLNKKIKYKGIPTRDKKDKILYNLQNKDYLFIKLLNDKKIIEIAKYFLNDEYYRFLPPNKPNFIFLDEPTGNLDEENAAIIQKLLLDISRKYNIALITATHDSNFIRNFDKIYKIQDMNLTEV